MQIHREVPETRLERMACLGGVLAALGASGWALLQIRGSAQPVHVWIFLALSGMVSLSIYLAWLLYGLSTTRYEVDGRRLRLILGPRQVEVVAGQMLQLCRWRSRWMWTGGVQTELGVEEVDLFPPFWLGAAPSTWVVVFQSDDGDRRAVTIRPSPELLATLKGWVGSSVRYRQ